jgi:fructose-1-phosphate kinase PfkB-like protein
VDGLGTRKQHFSVTTEEDSTEKKQQKDKVGSRKVLLCFLCFSRRPALEASLCGTIQRRMATILLTGLNPAWQKILEFGQLIPGQVNRALSLREFGSGKGLNAALVLARLGHRVSLLQIAGGTNGRRHEEYCRSLGVQPLSVNVRSETRVCSTLLERETGRATELIEPFSVGDDGTLERILETLPGPARCDALVMCGTAPAGVDTSVYLEIRRRVTAPLVVLDVAREVSRELLSEVDFLKVNAYEMAELEKRGLDLSGRQDRNPVVLVTDGPRVARMLRVGDRLGHETFFRIPELTRVRNPIGAGDTVTAYLTHALLAGMPAQEACREALAAGSASCLTVRPGDYDEETRQAIAAAIVMKTPD